MSTRTAAIDSSNLPDYAFGIAQDCASALANFIAPEVVVSSPIGKFKKYDNKQSFQIYSTDRPIGGPANRILFDGTDINYNCKPQALEIGVDDAERNPAGEFPEKIDEAKIRTLITAAAIAHEDRVISAIKSAVTAVGSVGVWSSASNDPIAEINAQVESIANATGVMPNRILFGLGAWRVFNDHAKVIARQPGAALIGLTPEGAAHFTINPQIQIRIGVLAKDTTKMGATKSTQNIVGSEVFIFYANPEPDVYDPSFAKTFTTHAGSVTNLRSYRDERSRSIVHAIDWSEDIQIVSTESVRRITLS